MGSIGTARATAALALAAAACAAAFVVQTVLVQHVPDELLVAVGAVGASVSALVVHGATAVREVVSGRPSQMALAAVGGLLAVWAAPYLALVARASDAPPGSVVVFMTASAWGLALACAASLQRRRRALGPVIVASAALATLGGAAVLASWERPSSFSPFVVFAAREARMLAAGVLFAAGVLLVERASRSRGTGPAVVSASAAAALAGALSALGSLPQPEVLAVRAGALAALAVASGLASVLLLKTACTVGPARAALGLLWVPGVLTALSAVERALWIHGPDPVVWPGVVAGTALIALGSVAVWVSAGRPVEREDAATRRAQRALAAALGSASAATLVLPAMRAEVAGALGRTFMASWEMLGAETAAGWLVALAGAAVAASLARPEAAAYEARRVVALVVLLSAALYAPLSAVPLRTLTRWIPADVQQTYGTEYARITFTPVHHGLRLVLLAVVVAAAIVLLVSSRAQAGGRAVQEGQG